MFNKKCLLYVRGASNLEELHTMMASKVMIRRLKKNVLSQLPPKQRQRIAFELKDSQLKKVSSSGSQRVEFLPMPK